MNHWNWMEMILVKKYVEKAAEEVRIAVDFSNWRTKPLVVYEYFDECDLKTSNLFSEQVN